MKIKKKIENLNNNWLLFNKLKILSLIYSSESIIVSLYTYCPKN